MFEEDPRLNPYDNRQATALHGSALSTAALVLAVLSAVSCFFIFTAVPLGALAIIFALLSRGRGKLSGRPFAAVLIGVLAIAASAGITGFSFYRVSTDPQLRQMFERTMDYYAQEYEQTYGEEFPIERPWHSEDIQPDTDGTSLPRGTGGEGGESSADPNFSGGELASFPAEFYAGGDYV